MQCKCATLAGDMVHIGACCRCPSLVSQVDEVYSQNYLYSLCASVTYIGGIASAGYIAEENGECHLYDGNW